MSTPVILTVTELKHAYIVGLDRWVQNRLRNATPNHGGNRTNPHHHMLGAVGEAVVAKHLTTWWTEHEGRPDRGEADVGPFHVRTIDAETNRLILHPEDHDDEPFVLVLVRADDPVNCQIIGWCLGCEGKRDEWWKDPTGHRPAFFVPHSALNPDLDAYHVGVPVRTIEVIPPPQPTYIASAF